MTTGSPEEENEVLEEDISSGETEQSAEETADGKTSDIEVELAETQDRLLRATADFENYKKRRQREAEELLRYGHESLVRELIPVLDSFERAILSSEGTRDYESFHDGVDLILQQLRDVLQRAGVTRIWPEGEEFDPHRHESVGICSHEEIKTDHIAVVLEPGYEINGRVVRPPKVLIVGSADTDESDREETESE